MCGLAGILTSASLRADELLAHARRMSCALAHRGPDDTGEWVDAACGVAFGFRRLAIIDLSEQGHQPMRSATGRYTLIFNGEVYNFRELRRELEGAGARFRGHSDTEVILAAIERWGVNAAAARFVGMFAIAVWDAQARSLSLVRDRLGIKPLFVHSRRGLVTFGSELKALVAGPAFDRTLDRGALAAYLRYLYVPGPRTIYRDTIKLPPGHVLTITDPSKPLPAPEPFWSLEDVAGRGLADPFGGSDREATDELEQLLRRAVELRMLADVPLGAFLSGGIDSSTVVALMQASSSRPVHTFSIAFEDEEYNEADCAARVARHLGTDHTELLLTGADALAAVPRLPEIFDEPLADTSQIPMLLICQLARRDVTVALSGDGGDEVFGGYNRYTRGERLLARMERVPASARRLLGAGITSVSREGWDRAYRVVTPVLPSALRYRLPGDKLHKIGRLMHAESVPRMYRSLISVWPHPERLIAGDVGAADPVERVLEAPSPARLLDRMMLADQLTYLVEEQLAKVDRVSMAVSVEVRVPLIDHRVVEFTWRLPPQMKVRDGVGKWLLRQLLYRYVPRDLVERQKMGLSVPIDRWLRGPLRPWAEDLLSEEMLGRDGLLNPAPIRRAWKGLQSGRGDLALGLWAVVMLQAWRQRWAA